MKDIAITIGCMVVSSVAASYIIREIQTDFWRSKHHYGNIKRSVNKKFKTAKA